MKNTHLIEENIPSESKSSESSLDQILNETCRRIAPLWPLKDYVAVNPFLGLSDHHFLQAATLFRMVGRAEILMAEKYYLEQLELGNISDEDIRDAVDYAKITVPSPWKVKLGAQNGKSLREEIICSGSRKVGNRIFSVADFIDQKQGTQWGAFVTEEISKWCSVYFDEGQSSWRMPWQNKSLFTAWREAALHDVNPLLSGLKSFGSMVRLLPEKSTLLLKRVLAEFRIPVNLQPNFLHRQLMTISGWSSYVQDRGKADDRVARKNQTLVDLMAIRMAYDLALWEQFKDVPDFQKEWDEKIREMQKIEPGLDLLPRYLALLATEIKYQRSVTEKLLSVPAKSKRPARRPDVHAVFCIDVRSEIYRRHLEAQHEGIQTSGFAGFFGMAIEYIPLGQSQGSAQCPVLLKPKYKIQEGVLRNKAKQREKILASKLFGQRVTHAWNAFKTSAISCFSFVETAGISYGYKLVQNTLNWEQDQEKDVTKTRFPVLECQSESARESEFGIPLADQIALAEGALKGMGMTSNFARLVLFCGHGSRTANNPYASGLDCGACGGHSGLINARITAMILNNPRIREGLKLKGIEVPDDTCFLAAEHNTTTDNIEIHDYQGLPATHQLEFVVMCDWLREASKCTRLERSQRLGLAETETHLHDKILSRSRDWSQVRPEWGLANNAALIAAPRERTRGMKLEGRTFLHDYEASSDPEGKVLELILTAPVVVANWINLQYYASTVNNKQFGSGNKTIHNVVGVMGIWQGNGGDLQVGLPLQSVHDGKTWMHEPLRLSVFVESPREAINRVLSTHAGVRELVQNGWFYLFALEPEKNEIWKYIADLKWQKVQG